MPGEYPDDGDLAHPVIPRPSVPGASMISGT
jgi:hypothetical protein